jgi:flavin-dependent dehydrogenase
MSRRHAAEAHILVVGSGPAGAATAIRLAHLGVRVTLTKREERRAPHGGEALPPAIVPLLRELGVLGDLHRSSHLPSYGNESAWGTDVVRMHSFMLSPYGTGWHIDRGAFDGMLLGAAARAGASVVFDGAPRATPTFVVDATGRGAHVARRHGVSRVHTDHMIAVVGVLQERAAAPRAGTSLVEAAEHGYWYSAPLPGDRLVCAYFTDAGLWKQSRHAAEQPSWHAGSQTQSKAAADVFHTLLRNTRHVSARAAGYGSACSPVVAPAGTSRLAEMHGPGWLAVGDAAACRDPLSSGGIYEAIRSGIRAADAIARQHDGHAGAIEAYAADLEARFSRDLLRRREVYLREQRFPESPFWARRAEHRMFNTR